MKNYYKRPACLKPPLKNKEIDGLIVELNKQMTDGVCQKIYEYIRELEREDKSE